MFISWFWLYSCFGNMAKFFLLTLILLYFNLCCWFSFAVNVLKFQNLLYSSQGFIVFLVLSLLFLPRTWRLLNYVAWISSFYSLQHVYCAVWNLLCGSEDLVVCLSPIDESSRSKVLVSTISKFGVQHYSQAVPPVIFWWPVVLKRTVDSNIQRLNQLDQRVVI